LSVSEFGVALDALEFERRVPEYLADREREERERFVGIRSDGRKWAVLELNDGALALKLSLPPPRMPKPAPRNTSCRKR
jgi:hypothetical protein